MSKMDESALLSHLQALEEDSSAFTWGRLGAEREKAMKEYFRQPYGNEEEGWSSIVTSEVQDTVEWMLPALLKIFTSTDKAVSFEPTREKDVQGAQQATDTCNYVFYKQNNGFLTLYTAFKDALLVKNCAVMWRKETRRTKSVTPATGATAEMLAMLLQEAGEDAEIESATPNEPQPMMGPGGPMLDPMTGQPMTGPPTFNARICSYAKKTTIKVEAFAPENLLVKRYWTSPLLHDCPYVARNMPVTLSELHEMGFDDVLPEDLASSDDAARSADAQFRQNRAGTSDLTFSDNPQTDTEDESQTQGFLRIEYVLVDFDGDGIAERREIYRLKDKILQNEEISHVPMATASPILVPHRWDGMSVAETMSDLQQLKTELTRQMLNSAYLSNNPRTEVLTDANWSPLANIDDLLDSRPGGIIRKRSENAITQNIVPFVGAQMLDLLGYVDQMGERRTGVSRAQQGMDPDALRNDKTAIEVQQTANAAAARIELIARIFAETLLKPIFQGILKLLTDGEMEKLAFRLRDEFVEYDPNEWRDSYDMTINVGLGTGDRNQQAMHLQQIFQQQGLLMQSPLGALMIKPKHVYNTLAKIIENAGFKNVGDFVEDPKDQMPPPPQTPPDPKIQVTQMQLAADAQKFQAESQQNMQLEQLKAQAKLQETQAQLELQAANDARDAERELLKAQYETQLEEQRLQLEKYKSDLDNETRIQVALINQQGRAQQAAQKAAQAGVE
ncbi:MAG: hypothetical protein H0X13_15425 [Ramlibacter sp.]|nr:hypothetical protein [Ramlibacter sp.]